MTKKGRPATGWSSGERHREKKGWGCGVEKRDGGGGLIKQRTEEVRRSRRLTGGGLGAAQFMAVHVLGRLRSRMLQVISKTTHLADLYLWPAYNFNGASTLNSLRSEERKWGEMADWALVGKVGKKTPPQKLIFTFHLDAMGAVKTCPVQTVNVNMLCHQCMFPCSDIYRGAQTSFIW